jgi:chromosome segregation ATPase
MIIGPNGTGKSSLVCAICLGLGFHYNVLGRATSFGEFVKHGNEHAIVEIELQGGPRDNGNFTVRLRLTEEDNGRKFWINNKESSHKDVVQLMQSLSIQIDNLCQFLPQDRVAEFAALSPVQLLEKTLQAAAPKQMTEWQKQLKDLFHEQREARSDITRDVDRLKVLEERQRGLEGDVEKLRESQKAKQKIEDLKTLHLAATAYELRRESQAANRDKTEAKRKHDELQEMLGPLLKAVTEKKEYHRQVDAVVQHRETELRQAEITADQRASEVESLDDEMKRLKDQAETETQLVNNSRDQILAVRQKIASLQRDLQRQPQPFHAATWNERIVRDSTS